MTAWFRRADIGLINRRQMPLVPSPALRLLRQTKPRKESKTATA